MCSEGAEALVKRKSEFIYMPSVNEMLITAERMHDRLKLPRLVYTVDGMQVRFSDAPRQQDSPDVLV